MMPPGDEFLMERVARGDEGSFVELVERWQDGLMRFFALSGIEDAEDAAQETFLRLFAYRDRYEARPGSFRALLFRIARNVAADCGRKRRRGKPCLAIDSITFAESEPLLDDGSGGSDARLDIEDAVRKLPEKLRSVVILNVYEGLAYRDIAAALSIPVGTVKSRMFHALAQLREVLSAPADR